MRTDILKEYGLGVAGQGSQDTQSDTQPPQVSFKDISDLYDTYVQQPKSSEQDYQDQLKSFQTRQRVNAAGNAFKVLAQGIASGAFGGGGGMLVDKDQPDRWTPYLTNEIQKQKELLTQEQQREQMAQMQASLNKFNLYNKEQDRAEDRFYQSKDKKDEQEFRKAIQDDTQEFTKSENALDRTQRTNEQIQEGKNSIATVKAKGEQDRWTDREKYNNQIKVITEELNADLQRNGLKGKADDPWLFKEGSDKTGYTLNHDEINKFSAKFEENPRYENTPLKDMLEESPSAGEKMIVLKKMASIYLNDYYDVVGGKLVPKSAKTPFDVGEVASYPTGQIPEWLK